MKTLFALALLLVSFFIAGYLFARKSGSTPVLLSTKKIWDFAPHNAFTDLLYDETRGLFFCCFREGSLHATGLSGQIRVLSSADGREWSDTALISFPNIDLRDPMLSLMPDGTLMINSGGTLWEGEKQIQRNSYVTFSSDGAHWTVPQKLPYPGEWIWRITWHKGKGYGAAYSDGPSDTLKLTFVETTDGLHYTFHKPFDLDLSPSEATFRFLTDDTAVALVRRKGPNGLIGHAKPPYDTWTWVNIKDRLGGPNFIILNSSMMWASSRFLDVRSQEDYDESVVLAKMDLTHYKPVLTLPSGGDSSYPGMVYKDGKLYLSYYSSHEDGKSSIYIAEIQLP